MIETTVGPVRITTEPEGGDADDVRGGADVHEGSRGPTEPDVASGSSVEDTDGAMRLEHPVVNETAGGPDLPGDDEALEDLDWLVDFDADEDAEVALSAEMNGQLGRHARVELGELRARLRVPSGPLGHVVLEHFAGGVSIVWDEEDLPGLLTSTYAHQLRGQFEDQGNDGFRYTVATVESVGGAPAGGPIDVVAAVRLNKPLQKVWLAKRNAEGKHAGLAGMWEYPGGKVEPDEQLRDALVRELHEEFDGITDLFIGGVLDCIEATYEGTTYRVTFFSVQWVQGEDFGSNCHTEWDWVSYKEACSLEHLPSGTIFNARHLAPAGGEENERLCCVSSGIVCTADDPCACCEYRSRLAGSPVPPTTSDALREAIIRISKFEPGE